MKTLYDLLEALPDDDADGLRAAFRKAAKANHPDFNPGNAEASEKFRRIVRANAILSDQRQRAEYDRLLELAMRQQRRQPKRRSRSTLFRGLATEAVAIAVVSVLLVGDYFTYKSTERPTLSTAQAVEIARETSAQVAVATSTDIADPSPQAVHDAEPPASRAEANAPDADAAPQTADMPAKPDAPASTTDDAAAANTFSPPPGDHGTKDIAYYRERGMIAYRNGELYLALANFDVAIDLDPGAPDSYIDRGIVFHRLGDLKRALSDVAKAKHLDDLNRSKYEPRTGTP